jgi:glycosyltransferase involved in cell wall biosynthesis
LKIVYIGDEIYTSSFATVDSSYFEGFPQRRQYFFREFADLEVEIQTFFHQPISSIEDAVDVRLKFERERMKKVDYFLIDNPLSIFAIPKQFGVPIIFDNIDWYLEYYLQEKKYDKGYSLLTYAMLETLERCDLMMGQSPVIIEQAKKWGLKTDKILVLPNGFRSEIFSPIRDQEESRRKTIFGDYNFEYTNQQVFVFAGKLNRWYADIINVAQAVEDDQVLAIVGEGPLRNEIPKKKNVILTGRLDLEEVSAFMNIADVCAFPSTPDCSPIAVSEYFGCGRGVITGRGRIEWLVKDGVNGVCVDATSYGWKRGLRRAYELKDKLAEGALKSSEGLSWKELSKKALAWLELEKKARGEK